MDGSALAPVAPGEPWVRITKAELAKLPDAARALYGEIHDLARKPFPIDNTDQWFARECGHGRRWVQKGLKQLQDVGIIDRIRGGGRRVIHFLKRLATRASESRPKPAPQPAVICEIQTELAAHGWGVTTRNGALVYHHTRSDPPPANLLPKDLQAKCRANTEALINHLDRRKPKRE